MWALIAKIAGMIIGSKIQGNALAKYAMNQMINSTKNQPQPQPQTIGG